MSIENGRSEKERGGYASLRHKSSNDSEFLPDIGSVMSYQKVCICAVLSNSVVG